MNTIRCISVCESDLRVLFRCVVVLGGAVSSLSSEKWRPGSAVPVGLGGKHEGAVESAIVARAAQPFYRGRVRGRDG